jgi:hypothetical protein
MDANKLRSILSGARAVMDAVDSNNYQKGNIDPSRLAGSTENLSESIPSNNYMGENQMMNQQTYQPNQPAYRNLHTTKMPKEIVQAMIENPIHTPDTPFHTFELTQDFLQEINPETTRKQQVQKPQKNTNPVQRLAETKRSSVMNLTEDEVRRIVREEMEEIIFEYFDQRVIKEDIQIKVGNTIFSGKLSPLPSKKSVKRK